MVPSSAPFAESMLCLECGARLVPLSSSLAEGAPGRPNLKCPKCGQSFVFRGSTLFGASWSSALQSPGQREDRSG